ncbi:MAG: hypothetical protein AMK73_07430 [Planctomycetes bacterium SM23_32]|nr:MAG: hypothetical protein AMK73_07430 [Planctomycetes bacterium SM23_32]
MWRSVIIFLFVYVIIASGRLHKAVVAVLGGCILIGLGGVSERAAYAEIDLNVIFLLLGMMVLVGALARTGVFQWVAISLARATRGSPVAVLVCLVAATGGLSAILDNVTTVLLMAPVTILIADELELDPTLFLIFEAIGSNVGGTATLVGDPPNLLIGSEVGLSFNAFLLNLAPIVLVCLGGLAGTIWLLYRRRLYVPEDIRARVRDAQPAGAITDRAEAIRVLAVLGLVLLGFFLHDTLGIAASVVALAGAMLALIVTGRDVHEAFGAVEWPTLMFFVGLFILVAGLDEQGVLAWIARRTVALTQGHLLLTVLVVLWGSAVISALVDNIPFVAAMVPVIGVVIPEIGAQMGLQDPAVVARLVGRPLWWSLALGACLGGNATLIGASANVVTAGLAEKHGRPISFGRFARYGVPTVVGTLLLCSVYVYVRYFLFVSWPSA